MDKAASTEDQRYRAPALEKGIDVLELLAGEPRALSFAMIAKRLGRSKSELFRVLLVMETRGYIVRAGADGYVLTDRMFLLGLSRPRHKLLAEAALPHMREVAESLEQSCHLAVSAGNQMVVIHRVESPGNLGFSVKVGHRRPLRQSVSGLVLLAFGDFARDDSELARVRSDGHAMRASNYVDGITDCSVPILVDGHAVAALTVPYVASRFARADTKQVLAALSEAASKIGGALETAPCASGEGRARL